MDKINTSGKVIGVAVIIVVVIILVFFFGGQKGQPSPSTNTAGSNSPAGSTNGTTTGANTGTGSTGNTGGTQPRHPAPFVIHWIAPIANQQWTIGVSNVISWDKAGIITGEVDLLDSKGNFVGVILSQTGSQQTSYSWDTREYALSRYSPLKKELVAGTYKIRLSFDGNNLPPIISPAIAIVN